MSRVIGQSIAVVVASVCLSACGYTDPKNIECGSLSTYKGEDDVAYCPDPSAIADCEALRDALIDNAADCGGVDAEELRIELEASGSTLVCENAVATKASYADCIAALEAEASCQEGQFEPGDVCKGVVLTNSPD